MKILDYFASNWTPPSGEGKIFKSFVGNWTFYSIKSSLVFDEQARLDYLEQNNTLFKE